MVTNKLVTMSITLHRYPYFYLLEDCNVQVQDSPLLMTATMLYNGSQNSLVLPN